MFRIGWKPVDNPSTMTLGVQKDVNEIYTKIG